MKENTTQVLEIAVLPGDGIGVEVTDAALELLAAVEAACGGPIALLRTGDRIRIDVEARVIETDADLSSRTAEPWQPSSEATGAYAKYAKLVGSASQGAITTGS